MASSSKPWRACHAGASAPAPSGQRQRQRQCQCAWCWSGARATTEHSVVDEAQRVGAGRVGCPISISISIYAAQWPTRTNAQFSSPIQLPIRGGGAVVTTIGLQVTDTRAPRTCAAAAQTAWMRHPWHVLGERGLVGNARASSPAFAFSIHTWHVFLRKDRRPQSTLR